mmetsp:Transcript_14002/g.56422  ORF Transcript_14002/g.56422 Transcript_14002/m.56422 type:complete len:104 (-) Transcript_14002:422-733(-)
MGVEPELCQARLSILDGNMNEARKVMQASSTIIEEATLDVDDFQAAEEAMLKFQRCDLGAYHKGGNRDFDDLMQKILDGKRKPRNDLSSDEEDERIRTEIPSF